MSDSGVSGDEEVIHLNYRRVDEGEEEEYEEANETFLEDMDEAVTEPSIIHLYSYTKEKIESPLSKISERESEYQSPDSKGSGQ